MRRLAFLLAFLILGLGSSVLSAAQCAAARAPITPEATSPWLLEKAPASPADAARPDKDDALRLSPLDSAKPMAPPPPNCGFTACYQTPEGCGCEGFYCNGQFICGYPFIF